MKQSSRIKTIFCVCSFVLLSLFLFSGETRSQAPVYNFMATGQAINDMVFSPKRRLLYASVPSIGGVYGNHIIAYDPFTKQVVDSEFVGSEPNKLAISDDEEVLYVGLDGSASVRKVMLETLTADLMFGLGTGSFGLLYPEDIVVLPGQTDSVAVSRRNICCSPRHEGVAIFDNGIMRPTVTPGHTGSNRIEPGADQSVLYGYNNETTEFGFRRMSVNVAGVSTISVLQNAIQGFSVDILYSEGLMYSTTGAILNPVTNTLHGTFSLQGFANGLVADERNKLIYFLQGSTLKAFDPLTFQPRGTAALSLSSHSFARLQRWGRRGFAYKSQTGELALFETALVPAQPNTSDFNGDEVADYAVFRPSTGAWFASSGMYDIPFGLSTDTPVAGDYDGDNKTDIAVYRDGDWYVLHSATQIVTVFRFGLPQDRPVPADYDGDHLVDRAVYRDGEWHVLRSSDSGYTVVNFGLAEDRPLPADFYGNGRVDFAVFRPENGTWYILANSGANFKIVQFGLGSAVPVPADYDGDGLADVAVWQNTFGSPIYYVLYSSTGEVREIQLDGGNTSLPFPMDLDGDGIADPNVMSETGNWTTHLSRSGWKITNPFGTLGDRLIAP